MKKIKCPKCQSSSFVKAGIIRNKQRYKCKKCNCFFTEGDKRRERGKSKEIKKIALTLYLEGIGFRTIERIFKDLGINVSHVAVIKWIRSLGKEVEKLKKERKENYNNVSIMVMELDEMWHFVKKNKISSGYGLHLIGKDTNPLISFWETEVKKLEKSYGRK